ncbi:AraC-like DNA-binding protein [Psychromicrobium silvestre]|uniref:AraC-like DNA-binding protein n=1 Tax=Psychromicrobium silvestre TaxID=1645614 RepID=A0A7Y9LQU6_9MICC|nr:AraC-like DNA-binding protein [Psychromicrobium silvestre]
MQAWTNATEGERARERPTSSDSGVLRPEQLAAFTSLQRHECMGPLGNWVENFWTLSWDLPEGKSFLSNTAPHPACTLSIERGNTRPEVHDPVVLTGIVTQRFEVELRGHGRVVAAKFRPGGLAALTGMSAHSWTDRTLPAKDQLPADLVTKLMQIDEPMSTEVAVNQLHEALSRLPHGEDPRYDQLLTIIADILSERSLVQVSQLENRYGLSARALQRLFERYVGVGPKWVLARYRLHDAMSLLDAGYQGSLADLATSLGWYDQAHFSRDFTALVGESPARYRIRER